MFLKKFIAGILFATTVSPLLDTLTTTLMTGLEAVKGKWAIKVAEYNNQINQVGEEPYTQTHAVGFSIPTEEDNYEEN